MSEAWQTAARALVGRLTPRDDIDHCADVELLGAVPGVIVHVSLADGRSAVRRIGEPRQLESVVESMLILLPPVASAPVASAASAPVTPTVAAPTVAAPVPPVASVAAPAAASAVPEATSSTTTIEAGLGASLHFTAHPSYFGYGMAGFLQVVVGRWLLGSIARWEADNIGTGQTLPRGFHMQSFTLGAMMGRRWRLDDLRVDVMGGPQMLVENQESEAHDPDSLTSLHGDISLGALVRLSGPHFFSVVSTELFPRRMETRYIDRSLPPLSPWGLGLSAGLMWGAP